MKAGDVLALIIMTLIMLFITYLGIIDMAWRS